MKFEILLFIALAVLIKLIPEFPHANPELVFSFYFLRYYPRLTASIAIMVMWLLGDLSYAWFYHTAAFGSWSLFNYSALGFFIWMFSAYPTPVHAPRLVRGVQVFTDFVHKNPGPRGQAAGRGRRKKEPRPDISTLNQHKPMPLLWLSISATLFFWLWSNLGVWLTSGMYPRTMTGFIHCYVLALPFLYDTELAALAWSCTLILLIQYQQRAPAKKYCNNVG